MTPAKFERIGLVLYLLGLLLSLWGISARYHAEAVHETTEVVLDASALIEWQEQLDERGADLPSKLLGKGIASLAFPELHLDDLTEGGLVVAQSATEFALTLASGALGDVADVDALQDHRSGGTYLIFDDAQTSRQLLPQLKVLFGDEVEVFSDGRILWLPASRRSLQAVGLGFDRRRIEEFQQIGFSIWLRPENRAGLSEPQLSALYEEWSTLPGVQGVIFSGALNEALGYPDLLERSAAELERLGWKIGYIELPARAQQDGIETLVRTLPGQTVRVMAVSPAHQAKLSPFRVLGMYSLGSRERNLRVLYVRPYAVPGRPELDEEFLFALPAELEGGGEASTFEPAGGPGLLFTSVVGVAAGALALLLVQSMGLRIRGMWWLLLLIPPFAGVLAYAVGKGTLYRSLLALAIGMGAPLYAFLKWVYPTVSDPPRERELAHGLRLLGLVSLMSLSAGIYLAALLTDTTFLLGVDRFRGVKLLTLGTPLLVVVCFLFRRYTLKQIGGGLRAYIAVYQAVLVGFLGLVLGFLYLRTGNDAGGAASESERTLRVVLDRVLGVRPRFKEFMLAHPAMVCAPLFAAKTGFLPSLVLVLLAGIGQAGIVDTFAHVHTPLDVTLVRVVLGVVLGAVVGVGVTGVFRMVEPPLKRRMARWSGLE